MADKKDDVIVVGDVLDYGVHGMTDADAGRNWVPPYPPTLPKPTSNEEKMDLVNSQSAVKTDSEKK